MTAPLLSVRDLTVCFDRPGAPPVTVLRGASLDLEAGMRLGLVGESGSGKSTLALALMGLLPAEAWVCGRIALDGADLLQGGEAAFRRIRWREVAMVFQGALNALNPLQPVAAQIAEPMRLHGRATRVAAQQRAEDLLARVGLDPARAKAYPHELSGGQRQRVMIAMALACAPRILLADEPTTALDVIVQAQVIDLLARLSAEEGLATVLVSHDIALVAGFCDRIAVMYAGQIVESGPVQAVVHAPAHPYTAALIAATPDLAPGHPGRSLPGAPPRLDQPMAGCPFAPRCSHAAEVCHRTAPALSARSAGHASACHMAQGA